MKVTDVQFTMARAQEAQAGLLGFLVLVIDDALRVDGITLRRTLDGRLALSFPVNRAGARRYPIVRPLDDGARRDIEQQVFAALGLSAEAPH